MVLSYKLSTYSDELRFPGKNIPCWPFPTVSEPQKLDDLPGPVVPSDSSPERSPHLKTIQSKAPFGRWTPMGLGEAPFFCFSDLLSISPSSFTTDISKRIPINVCAVANEPMFQESSLAQASVKWPWVGLVPRGDSGRLQTLTFPESLFS